MANALAPIGLVEYLSNRYADSYTIMQMVNRWVNNQITPTSKTPSPADPWNFLPKFGHCHDYVISKAELLSRLGCDPKNLQITVVKIIDQGSEDGQYHAVLILGGWVLDNRIAIVRELSTMKNNYEIVSWCTFNDPLKWSDNQPES